MRFQTFIAPCSIIIALTSCTKTRLEQALCASGSHRQELEKVLTGILKINILSNSHQILQKSSVLKKNIFMELNEEKIKEL